MTKRIFSFLLVLLLASNAYAGGSQPTPPAGANNSVQVNNSGAFGGVAPINGNCLIGSAGAWVSGACSAGSSVSVTSSTSDIVVSPSPGTGTFTVGSTSQLNARGTASTYTITAADMGKTVTHASGSAVADTLAQAGTTGFGSGVSFTAANFGAGAVTVTPTTSTINGASNLKLYNGGFAWVISDGTNYSALDFPGYGTITSGALVKFTPDTSGAFTAAAAGTDYQAPLTLTTTGTSGAATLVGSTLNVPQYSGGGGGVSSLNSLTGALNIVAGSNITVTPSGSNITIAASSSASTNLGASTSAASPQISGDATTGLYTPGAAQVGVSIGGTGRALWTSTGLTNTGTFTTTGAETNSAASAASAPAILASGAAFTGGSGTTTFPHVFVQPTGATAVTDWSTFGTVLGMNMASGFNGRLIDLRVNGSATLFNVGASGSATIASAGSYIMNARSKMSSPVDGVVLLNNNAGSGFTGLKFGLTTSAFPYLKVNGTGLSLRVGDDTADAPFSAANVTSSGAYVSGGTKFTATGCANSTTVGGATAGTLVSGTTGTCTVVITLPAAPNGWHCAASDRTAKTPMPTTASSTTSCTIEASTTTGDTISFAAMAY